ncbi:thiamine phosphate synthase [bacterium]|jgi:thiamine-phosphate pyrophosphorylase|nr:thiamine phosphate synthase [bacterium]
MIQHNLNANLTIIDANINRVAEGLRVIEDFCRFRFKNREWSKTLSNMRQTVNLSETNPLANLSVRNTESDMRAREIPRSRINVVDVLKANFKRVEEGLRVLEEVSDRPCYTQLRYDAYDLEKDIILHESKTGIKPGVYIISDDPDVLIEALSWDASIIQLRNKDKNVHKSVLLNQSMLLSKKAKEAGVPFVVNDYIDIALLVDADGFHTGQDDLPVSEIRKILGDHKLIGRTTHSFEQGEQAVAEGADYVSVGPVWETPSKPGRDGIGFDYLKQAHKLSVPFVAIGGVNNSNVDEVLAYSPKWVGIIRDYKMGAVIQKKLRTE